MNVKPGLYDQSYSAYVEYMADELRKRSPKRPKTTDQCASTQAALSRAVEDDLTHWLRPIPINWKANPNAKTTDEAVGLRLFDAQQVAVVEDIRRKGRNTLGQSELSSVTSEKKEKAIHAFTYSQPAELTFEQKQKAKENEMTAIKEHEPTTADIKTSDQLLKTWDIHRTWWDKLFDRWRMKNIRDRK